MLLFTKLALQILFDFEIKYLRIKLDAYILTHIIIYPIIPRILPDKIKTTLKLACISLQLCLSVPTVIFHVTCVANNKSQPSRH